MANFEYKPLVVSHRQIRLIRLLPRNYRQGHTQASTGQQPRVNYNLSWQGGLQLKLPQWEIARYPVREQLISCKMSPFSLEDRPPYTALSYAWGDPSPTKSIIINGAVFRVTESVETALRHLQHETDTVTLWIDQLCINQDDIAKKNEQVVMMKDIYKGATRVLIWLGPAADESDHLMDVLADVGKEAYQFGVMGLDLSDLRTFSGKPLDQCKLAVKDSLNRLVQRIGLTSPLKALRSFTERPWWLRVWVMQELSVARDVNFACGEKRISYDHLQAALFFFVLYTWTLSFNLNNSYPSEEMVQFLNALMSAPVNSAASSMLSIRRKYRDGINGEGYTLYRLLEKSHTLDSGSIKLQAQTTETRYTAFLASRETQKSWAYAQTTPNPVLKSIPM
jgi:Heterokaryon incompatibility protein (HET)